MWYIRKEIEIKYNSQLVRGVEGVAERWLGDINLIRGRVSLQNIISPCPLYIFAIEAAEIYRN